jgi:hypothetical protein
VILFFNPDRFSKAPWTIGGGAGKAAGGGSGGGGGGGGGGLGGLVPICVSGLELIVFPQRSDQLINVSNFQYNFQKSIPCFFP